MQRSTRVRQKNRRENVGNKLYSSFHRNNSQSSVNKLRVGLLDNFSGSGACKKKKIEAIPCLAPESWVIRRIMVQLSKGMCGYSCLLLKSQQTGQVERSVCFISDASNCRGGGRRWQTFVQKLTPPH